MKLVIAAVVFCLLVTALGGCACTLELGQEVTPRIANLAVGQSVTPTITLTSCGGARRFTEPFVWTTANPSVATVDRATGEITGRSIGETEVLATSESTIVFIPVTVTAD